MLTAKLFWIGFFSSYILITAFIGYVISVAKAHSKPKNLSSGGTIPTLNYAHA